MEEKKGYRAVGKYLMVSPKKVRPIADLIRRKPYTEAVAQLEAIPNGGAAMLKKVLQSAAANALSQNKQLPQVGSNADARRECEVRSGFPWPSFSPRSSPNSSQPSHPRLRG